MPNRIAIVTSGHATSLFLTATYTLCVIFDLLFPQHAMYTAWQKLLPGFEWISWRSYFIGLSESYLYGWYAAVMWGLLYNGLSRRKGD